MNRVGPFCFCRLLYLMAIAAAVPQLRGKRRRRSKCNRLPLPRTRLIRSRPDLSRGMIRGVGKEPLPKEIDMSGDPACVEAHYGNALNGKAGLYYV
jgi:hypothetical protein